MFKTLAGLAGALWLWQAASCLAEPVNLALVQADIDGNGEKETVELYGEKLNEESGYYHNLLVLVRGRDGKMQTAYAPLLQGGYGCLLETMPQRGGWENVVLSAAQGGDGGDVAFRILDFKNPKQVKERFTGADNLGLTAAAAYLPEHRYKVNYKLEGKDEEQVEDITSSEDRQKVYDEAGKLVKPYLRPQVGNLSSLTAYQDRLYTRQNVVDADGSTVLGVLDLTWSQKEQVWKPTAARVMNADWDNEQELIRSRVNVNAGTDNWQLYSRGYWLKGVEINYPVVAVNEHPEVQDAINREISAWLKGSFVEDERAYRVEFAGPNLLSLILFREGQDGNINKNIVNFDMRTGRKLSVRDVFKVEDKDFLKVLGLVGMPRQELKAVPENWYFNGRVFTFVVPKDTLVPAGKSTAAPKAKAVKVVKPTEVKPVKVKSTGVKPAVEAKPAAETKPAVEVKPAVEAKPAVEVKPAAAAQPAATKVRPKTAVKAPARAGKKVKLNVRTQEMIVSSMDLYNFVRDKALPASK